MKTLIAIAAGLLISASVTARPIDTNHQGQTFVTDNFGTKQEALNAGFDIYESLNTASSQELRQKLSGFGNDIVLGITVDSAQVKVEEISTSRDNIMYRAVVDVDYTYRSKDRDDN
ncbi:DUF3316 domain-containing protein [Vibrio hannami]|uniref:DUF3316 domain-containing protein n=1 Tax=Vibrio hannami TaxID=2717094 RepID=UPI00240F769D|nr:DUF3316 domain-containing protein [Vibrio hannami]MDG3085722.1 DUF3316 domain-containing protein [Vibrio hannami]